MVLLQKLEDEDLALKEVEVTNMADTPKLTKKKRRRSCLIKQRLSAISFRRWVIFRLISLLSSKENYCQTDQCYGDKKKKSKEEKANVIEEIEEESALMMAICNEYGGIASRSKWFI